MTSSSCAWNALSAIKLQTPIRELPDAYDLCFAVIGSPLEIGPDSSVVGAVHFGSTPYEQSSWSLTLLDWDIKPLYAGTTSEWQASVLDRLRALHPQSQTTHPFPQIWIENTEVGRPCLNWARRQQWPVHDVAERAEVPAHLAARALLASEFIGAGRVKIAREAFQKTEILRGIARNYFTAQLLDYVVNDKSSGGNALVSAFCTGCLLALQR